MDKDSADKGKRKSSNKSSVLVVAEESGQGLTEEEFFLSSQDGSVSGKKHNGRIEEEKEKVPKDQSIRFFLPETF